MSEIGQYLVLHDLMAYRQHPDLICNFLNRQAKTKWKKPVSRLFGKIRRGDRIVYYATNDSLVIGIFQIASDILYIENDQHWGSDVAAFRIEPFKLPPNGYFLDFKALMRETRARFDMFPKREIWYSYLQGHSTKRMTSNDFRIVGKSLDQGRYLVPQERFVPADTDWHRKLAWLRDLRFEPITFLKRDSPSYGKKYLR